MRVRKTAHQKKPLDFFWREFDARTIEEVVDRMDDYFHRESVFCFTSDIDWAPEAAIAMTIDAFERLGLPATFFVTHRSAVVAKRLKSRPERVGAHPNFLAGSTHGATLETQVKTARSLWPMAKAFRAHAYFDNTVVLRELFDAGFEYDSNAFQFMQPYISPEFHHTGLMRFPVFWEDDIHGGKYEFRLRTIRRGLEKPGLKIFNFHPLWVSLNIPSLTFYRKHKFLSGPSQRARDIGEYVFPGVGAGTFLQEVASYVSDHRSLVSSLDKLYATVLGGFRNEDFSG